VDFSCNDNLSLLNKLPHTQNFIETCDQFESALKEINNLLDQRSAHKKHANQAIPGTHSPYSQQPPLVMAIDGLDQLRLETSEENRNLLGNLMRRKGLNFHVIATGACQDFSTYSHADNLGTVFKEHQTGFLVGYNDFDDLQYLPIKLSPLDCQHYLPPGHAFYVRRGGGYRIVQIASTHHGKLTIDDWIEVISKKRN
jgi:hypothetical protein